MIYNPISIYHREDRAITLNVVSPLLLFDQMLLLGLDLTWMLVMLIGTAKEAYAPAFATVYFDAG